MTKQKDFGVKNIGAVLHGIKDLRISDIPIPEPGPHEVLVMPRTVGICGTLHHLHMNTAA